jgi:hypothetical protein
MDENGFSKSYIKQMRMFCNHVMRLGDKSDVESFEDVYNILNNSGYSMHPNAIIDRKGFIGIIKQFVETGIYPSVSSRTGFMRDSSINKLCKDFRQIIDTYINVAQANGISDNYIYTCSRNASCFFLSLQNRGKSMEDTDFYRFPQNKETKLT